MKKIIFSLLLVLSIFSFCFGGEFSKVASKEPTLIMKGDEKYWCPVCGMNLKMYYKTSHGVYLKDGSARQYCSIRCLVVDYPKTKDSISSIVVVDAHTENLISAQTAFYLIGSSIPGTMSKVSKLAFANKKDAEVYKNKYGGEISDFSTAFKKAQDSLSEDAEMMQKKKSSEMYPMGEKLFKEKCSPGIEPSRYGKINDLKADISKNKLCKDLDEKQLQAVSLYLWEVKRLSTSPASSNSIPAPINAK